MTTRANTWDPGGIEMPAAIPRLSLGLVAIVACGLLIYTSGSFVFAEILGIKRVLQIVLVLTLLAAAVTYGIRMPLRMVDPLMIFVIVMLVTELAFRGKALYIIEGVSTLLALIVIYSVPVRTFWIGARVLVLIAAAFALMALIQWVILFVVPDLGRYRIFISEEGVIENSVRHPIMYLGLFGEQQYTFLGRPVARIQSFALEPSLNVVYFMLPASLAMLLNRPAYFIAGMIIAAFCALSFSGSVFLSVAFSVIWLPLIAFVPLRFAFSYGLIALLIGYFYAIQRVGLDAMIAGLAVLSEYGDFFGKSTSLTVRGGAATENLAVALSSPLGSSSLSDMAGPWLINGVLAAGWIGAVLIVVFLIRMGARIQQLNEGYGLFSRTRIGSLALLGALSTIVVFNDYQVSNYAGLALLAFIYRAIDSRNFAEAAPNQNSSLAIGSRQ